MFKNLFISYFLWPFYLLHSPSVPDLKALQIFRSNFLRSKTLSHIKQGSKHNTYPIYS
jgi:hypothetical protein